jgi:hypothetical protein
MASPVVIEHFDAIEQLHLRIAVTRRRRIVGPSLGLNVLHAGIFDADLLIVRGTFREESRPSEIREPLQEIG